MVDCSITFSVSSFVCLTFLLDKLVNSSDIYIYIHVHINIYTHTQICVCEYTYMLYVTWKFIHINRCACIFLYILPLCVTVWTSDYKRYLELFSYFQTMGVLHYWKLNWSYVSDISISCPFPSAWRVKQRSSRMLESYVTPILLSYVNRYIKNLKPSDLQLSLWGGDVVLSKLELKLDVLEQVSYVYSSYNPCLWFKIRCLNYFRLVCTAK